MVVGSIVIVACNEHEEGEEEVMYDSPNDDDEETCRSCINSRNYDAMTYVTHCTIIFYHISII
jgi:hypothetical protein